jgi:N6-L-threonylcarbamoyladenine synthase
MTENTETKKEIKILAIESSCDETAAAVVVNGRDLRSNVISSQIALHTLYGGVVPEIASRKHIEKINQVIEQALSDAHMTLDDIDAIGVTYGPGLVGALLVGVAEAKAIAYARNIPLVGVHHIEGHISANYIENKDLEPPFLALVVSGGHTHLVRVVDYGKYEILGRTRDDAAGEAFDKVARAIGLGYPGGPKIEFNTLARAHFLHRMTDNTIRSNASRNGKFVHFKLIYGILSVSDKHICNRLLERCCHVCLVYFQSLHPAAV